MSTSEGPSPSAGVVAYPAAWRLVAALLVGVSRASLPAGFVLGLLTSEPISLFNWLRMLLLFAAAPAAAAHLIARAFAARVAVSDGVLLLQRQDLRLELPCAAITRIRPWLVPLPGAGLSLRLQSGRGFPYRLQLDDPLPLLELFAEAGVNPAVATARHPVTLYAHAKHDTGRQSWYHPLAKFVGFGLLPAGVWFYAHQHIAYGALLGQYYLEGLERYLATFIVSWALTSVYLLLYASVWRALGEAVAWLTTWVLPQHSGGVRRVIEITCAAAYYGGVPLFVVLPFVR